MPYLPPPSSLPPGSIVDSYRRDSGGPKQEKSTDQQFAVIEEYCRKHGLTHRYHFLDKSESGKSTDNRDDFNRMISLYRDATQRPHGLLLWSFARFAREIDNAIYYKAYIRTKKIIIHSLIDKIPEGDYGRIVEFFIDMSNEEKRKQASTESQRGLRDLVRLHGCVPGTPPRGFKRIPVDLGNHSDGSKHIAHRWVPDPKQTYRIKQAFEMRAAGSTLKAIHDATRLYSSINSYKTFFTNRIYIGILEYGDLVIEDYCKPIIDIDTWNTVQKIVTQYAKARTTERHPKRANSPYLLSGLLYCHQCGAPMNGNTVSRHTIHGKDEAYRCSRSKRHAGCTAGRIARHAVETAVLDSLKDFVLVPENLEAIHNLALEAQAEFETKRAERKTTLTAERNKVASRIANITRAIAEHGHSQALLDSLSNLEAQRAQINTELADLNIPLAAKLEPLPDHPPRVNPRTVPPHAREHFESVSRGFLKLLQRGTPDQVKSFIQSFVHKITAERTGKEIHGTITYYYPPLEPDPDKAEKAASSPKGGSSPFESAPTSGTMLPISCPPVGAPT